MKKKTMLKELVEEFVFGNKIIITAPTGHGSTVLTLHIVSILLEKDNKIIYYNSTGDIDSNYIKPVYPSIYKDVFFHKESLGLLTNFLDYINYDIDSLILDPGDSLMSNKKIYPLLNTVLNPKVSLIATSQIRQDPTKGGQIYSPLEELNKSYNSSIFQYSIWIRDVTESVHLFKARYIDVYKNYRTGNKFIRRYLVRFDIKTGVLVE
jgi:hypothetical protein